MAIFWYALVMTDGHIIIVIPTYNERENIKPLVSGINAVLPEAKILFVDDNSPDGTASVIKELQRDNPDILLIQREAKLGLGTAYIEAFRKILQERLAEIIVTMDGDLSHPIEAILPMVNLLNSNDLVIGSRYIKRGEIKNWPLHRKLLSYFANMYARSLINIPFHDMTSGFMAIKASVLSEINLNQINSDGYAFLIELKYLISRIGNKISEYPITFTERRLGKSKLSSKVILEAVILPIKIFLRRL